MLKRFWSKIFGPSIDNNESKNMPYTDESLVNPKLENELRMKILALRWYTNPETTKLITHYVIDTLREAQTCSRCILRFLNYHDRDIYTYSEQELDYAFDHILERSKPSKVKVCTACLGALQYADDHNLIIKPLLEKLEKEQYDANTFSITSSLPISMLHRDKLLKFHVTSKLNTSYIKDLIAKHANNVEGIDKVLKAWKTVQIRDPKEPFRNIVAKQLMQATLSTTTASDDTTGETIDHCLTFSQHAPFTIHIDMQHLPTSEEHLFLTQVKHPIFLTRKVKKKGKYKLIGDSRPNIVEAVKVLKEDEARRITTIPPSPQSEIAQIEEITLTHVAAYIGGRYLKFSRECSQTPWSIKGQMLAENSVSECMVNVFKKYHRCDDIKFTSAGREDANVRMLGTGRPFYCALINPRRPVLKEEDYHQMEMEINSAPKTKDIVQVRRLRPISPKDISIIKEGEEKKRKTYRALVWLSEPLTQKMIDECNKAGEKEFITYQKTPIRVFQRRGAGVREKTIHSLKMERIDEKPDSHFVVIHMTTQAGTYVKEFVHGDLGRTTPNLATIAGVKFADLIELDVTDVELDWPPAHEYF